VTHAQREHALAVMDYLYAHRSVFDYPPGDQRDNRDGFTWHLTESRLHAFVAGGGRPQLDCSEAGSFVLKCAGAWHWSSAGYTGSHLETIHPHYTDARAAGVAALVVFGPGTGHHEAVVHTPDATHGDPLLWSHGHSGCDLIKLSVLAESQARSGHPGVRFLSVAHL